LTLKYQTEIKETQKIYVKENFVYKRFYYFKKNKYIGKSKEEIVKYIGEKLPKNLNENPSIKIISKNLKFLEEYLNQRITPKQIYLDSQRFVKILREFGLILNVS
jgi:hypothetical protein